jgi:hypothetical protein
VGTSSTGFWKRSSLSAVPGRPNLSPGVAQAKATSADARGGGLLTTGGAARPGGATQVSSIAGDAASGSSKPASAKGPTTATVMPKSFVAFEASVSDAWTVLEDPDPNLQQGEAGGNATPSSTSSTSTSLPVSSSINGGDNGPATTTRASKAKTSSLDHHEPLPPQCSRLEKLADYLAGDSVELETLRKLSWSGLPPSARPKAWKILCGYLPPGPALRQNEVLERKREEYALYVEQYFLTKDTDQHQETFRQIHIDIPRMSPVIALFQQKVVQELFERVLYIWAIRHPASGYVQGINDLVTPFFLVFLEDAIGKRLVGKELSELDVAASLDKAQLAKIEADSFWCLTKVLDGIQDNYTFAQPGIQLKVRQLEELIKRIDAELHNHLASREVLFLQFAFRWMNNILMRELPIAATIRLWDTYLSENDGFSRFHLYVCAAFLIRWKQELLCRKDFHTLLMFLQSVPTAKWGDEDIELLVAEAWKLLALFADAPKHLVS